jgi:hypothetical protein
MLWSLWNNVYFERLLHKSTKNNALFHVLNNNLDTITKRYLQVLYLFLVFNFFLKNYIYYDITYFLIVVAVYLVINVDCRWPQNHIL